MMEALPPPSNPLDTHRLRSYELDLNERGAQGATDEPMPPVVSMASPAVGKGGERAESTPAAPDEAHSRRYRAFASVDVSVLSLTLGVTAASVAMLILALVLSAGSWIPTCADGCVSLTRAAKSLDLSHLSYSHYFVHFRFVMHAILLIRCCREEGSGGRDHLPARDADVRRQRDT